MLGNALFVYAAERSSTPDSSLHQLFTRSIHSNEKMSGLPRPGQPSLKRTTTSMRPPLSRPTSNLARGRSATPAHTGRASPALSVASSRTTKSSPLAGAKRKAREYEEGSQETNINVVVRCRGRNERELKENSGVVVKTDGIKGNAVELSMGPNALSNKSYQFDKVFSPAADQSMIFDEVVTPILDEVR
jgi:kinesin family protein 11